MASVTSFSHQPPASSCFPLPLFLPLFLVCTLFLYLKESLSCSSFWLVLQLKQWREFLHIAHIYITTNHLMFYCVKQNKFLLFQDAFRDSKEKLSNLQDERSFLDTQKAESSIFQYKNIRNETHIAKGDEPFLLTCSAKIYSICKSVVCLHVFNLHQSIH